MGIACAFYATTFANAAQFNASSVVSGAGVIQSASGLSHITSTSATPQNGLTVPTYVSLANMSLTTVATAVDFWAGQTQDYALIIQDANPGGGDSHQFAFRVGFNGYCTTTQSLITGAWVAGFDPVPAKTWTSASGFTYLVKLNGVPPLGPQGSPPGNLYITITAPDFTLADAQAALKIAAGLQKATTADMLRLNYAYSSPGRIDLRDATAILRKIAKVDP